MDTSQTLKVQFVCAGNSARSILTKAVMNHLGAPRLQAFSAASRATDQAHPPTLQTLARLPLPSGSHRSKSCEEFSASDAPARDFVFTVCDQAAGEACPVWPSQPVGAHRGMPDLAAVLGRKDGRQQAFLNAAVRLKRRIEQLLALPFPGQGRISPQRAIRDIGQARPA